MNKRDGVREETKYVGIKEESQRVEYKGENRRGRDIIKRCWEGWRSTCESRNQCVESAIGQSRA